MPDSKTAAVSPIKAERVAAIRCRIGILTLHYVPNYGAILQSLAAARLFNAEIIDHRYCSKVRNYSALGLDRESLQHFIDHQLPLSRHQFCVEDFESEETFRFIEREGYDLLAVGSDELWKTDYSIVSPRRQFAKSFLRSPYRSITDYAWAQTNPWSTPFPNVYWPKVSIPCVGFAGSIGETPVHLIPERHRRAMGDRLAGFELVGVRDTRTAEFFAEICPQLGDALRIIPDPVFTFSASQHDRDAAFEVLEAAGVDPHRPFAFLNVMSNTKEQYVRELQSLGLQVADLLDMPLSPPQWFAAIGAAEVGVTEAMHPLIASLVQNIPCLSIDTRHKSQELRSNFGVDRYETVAEIMENWPATIPGQAAECARRVRSFVQEARNFARCSSA